MKTPVLLLNRDYQPLQVCHAGRAVVLLDRGKAEVLEQRGDPLRAASRMLPRPSVIRLVYQIRRPRPPLRPNRRGIFARDQQTCQYCGARPGARGLTLDHVVPRHRGGRDTWTNLVTACAPCNHRKGGRTPAEARMPLRRPPFEPRATAETLFAPYLGDNAGWGKFLGLP